jgi:hypothetical protein
VLERPEKSSRSSDQRLRSEIQRLNTELAAMRQSRSWRITAPLRAVGRRIRR